MTEPPTTGHATERSPQQLAAATRRDRGRRVRRLPGTLTATASGLFVLYASPPAFATPDWRCSLPHSPSALVRHSSLAPYSDDTPTHLSRCCRTRGPHAVCRRGRSWPQRTARLGISGPMTTTPTTQDLTLTERLRDDRHGPLVGRWRRRRSRRPRKLRGRHNRRRRGPIRRTSAPPRRPTRAETINGNSTQIVDYLNNQTDAANASVDNTTVHELRLVDEDHALSESIYLVFEYDQTTGQWTTLTAHESYNGSADYEHRFSGIPRDEHRRRN